MPRPGRQGATYDDAQGLSAAFNLNLLRRLNRDVQMDCDLERFSHCASHGPPQGVVRGFLVSKAIQVVNSGTLRQQFSFKKGETIFTAQSQKYTRKSIQDLALDSGFRPSAVLTDDIEW